MGVLRERKARLNSLNPGAHVTERHQEHVTIVRAISDGNLRLAEAASLIHVELGHGRTSQALRQRNS
jgi:DNA-binding FadR family transcriptional regulator